MSIRHASIVLALLLAVGIEAYAQDRGFYAGASAGKSKAIQPVVCSDGFDLNFPFTCNSSNDTATGWKIFGGYQFSRYLAAEAGYVDLGKFKTSAHGVFLGFNQQVDTSDHPSGFNLDSVWTLPIGEGFGLFARIGIFGWTLKAQTQLSALNAGGNDTAHGFGGDIGLGAKWDFARNLGMRVEWQRFLSIGDSTTGKSDVDLISASLLFRFN